MKIIYNSQNDATPFDIDRFTTSLEQYDSTITREKVEEALTKYSYDPMHVSVLVEIGVNLITDDDKAKEYYKKYQEWLGGEFYRLRRISGYLVGTLSRWNDAKKAEEKARVKHNIDNAVERQL